MDPWYAELFRNEGFHVERIGLRVPGSKIPIDRVNMSVGDKVAPSRVFFADGGGDAGTPRSGRRRSFNRGGGSCDNSFYEACASRNACFLFTSCERRGRRERDPSDERESLLKSSSNDLVQSQLL
jgi:hypothetical protein